MLRENCENISHFPDILRTSKIEDFNLQVWPARTSAILKDSVVLEGSVLLKDFVMLRDLAMLRDSVLLRASAISIVEEKVFHRL